MPLFAPWWPQVFRCDPAKPGTHSTQAIVIEPGLRPDPCEKTTVKRMHQELNLGDYKVGYGFRDRRITALPYIQLSD